MIFWTRHIRVGEYFIQQIRRLFRKYVTTSKLTSNACNVTSAFYKLNYTVGRDKIKCVVLKCRESCALLYAINNGMYFLALCYDIWTNKVKSRTNVTLPVVILTILRYL